MYVCMYVLMCMYVCVYVCMYIEKLTLVPHPLNRSAWTFWGLTLIQSPYNEEMTINVCMYVFKSTTRWTYPSLRRSPPSVSMMFIGLMSLCRILLSWRNCRAIASCTIHLHIYIHTYIHCSLSVERRYALYIYKYVFMYVYFMDIWNYFSTNS